MRLAERATGRSTQSPARVAPKPKRFKSLEEWRAERAQPPSPSPPPSPPEAEADEDDIEVASPRKQAQTWSPSWRRKKPPTTEEPITPVKMTRPSQTTDVDAASAVSANMLPQSPDKATEQELKEVEDPKGVAEEIDGVDDAKGKRRRMSSVFRKLAKAEEGGLIRTRRKPTEEEVEAARKAEMRERLKELIPYGRCYRSTRWYLAWAINIFLYIVLLAVNFVYAVQYGNVAYEQVLVAWVLSLSTSFFVAEPSQVLGSVLIPYLTSNEKAQAWMDFFKEEVLGRLGCGSSF